VRTRPSTPTVSPGSGEIRKDLKQTLLVFDPFLMAASNWSGSWHVAMRAGSLEIASIEIADAKTKTRSQGSGFAVCGVERKRFELSTSAVRLQRSTN
jgi:hypothetical protein